MVTDLKTTSKYCNKYWGKGRANVKKGQFENKRTFTWNDHHEVRLVFTEVFTKRETNEDEQEQGYGGERREEEETNRLS